MSKYLDELVAGVEWINVLEYVSVMVLDKHRKGTPTIKLADYAVPEGWCFA